MENTAIAYSYIDFNGMCQDNGWNDFNVESISDKAFISIIGTEECQKYYLEESEEHWFKQNHLNVLNLEFDDISEDMVYHGHKLSALNEKQANELFSFIEKNIGKDFIIHCRAGVSRSQAVASFINDMYYENGYCEIETHIKLKRPNQHVLTSLKHCYYQKYGFAAI